MVWSEAKDYVMLKEVAAEGVFDNKPGTRERGTSWQKVANKLNSLPQFSVNSRAIRDRFNNISRKLKAKLARESNESGGGDMEEPTELEMLLEELLQLNEESEKKSHDQNEAKKETLEKERKQAIEMRERAMESMGETKKRNVDRTNREEEPVKTEKRRRRSGGDTLEWLRERAATETQMKERELEGKKKERQELEAMRKQQGEQVAMLQQQMLQLIQQQQQQQQQQQFAMMQQQMLAVIQQQQQQAQALFNLVKKKE